MDDPRSAALLAASSSIEVDGAERSSAYLERTGIMVTTLRQRRSEAHLIEYFVLSGARVEPPPRPVLVRIVEGQRGVVDFRIAVALRLGHGARASRIRQLGDGVFAAMGARDGLLVRSELALEQLDGMGGLVGEGSVGPYERRCIELAYRPAAELEPPPGISPLDPDEVEESLDATVASWRRRDRSETAR